jgi:Tfp pilus assembly protein PilO
VDIEKIKEILNKIPVVLLLVAYLGNLGYDYYSFTNDSTSPLGDKKSQLEAAKTNNAQLKVKLNELQTFVKTLEAKKVALRNMVEEFQQVSGALSDHLDIPLFMKMVLTEARRAGLKVEGLKPKGITEKEFYQESGFDFTYRGVFVQLLRFLQRLALTTEIIRIEDLNMKPNSPASGRFVEITGGLEIKTYSYSAAKVDALVKQMSTNSDAGTKNDKSTGPNKGPSKSPVSAAKGKAS